jgi:hypothetical protein
MRVQVFAKILLLKLIKDANHYEFRIVLFNSHPSLSQLKAKFSKSNGSHPQEKSAKIDP